MKVIGIIGGCTDLSTAEYYKMINARVRQELGGLHTGEIIINSMDCARITHFIHNDLWDEAAAYLHAKAQSLERAGADFIICVSNTSHRVSQKFMEGIKVPLLHIADPTAKAIKDHGLSNVALLGTLPTMSSPYYRNYLLEHHDITVTVPTEAQQKYVDDVIFKELVHSNFTADSRQGYLAIIDELTRNGAQGVILGCTEIPLLVSQAARPYIPMFNTLELHASAAAQKSLSG